MDFYNQRCCLGLFLLQIRRVRESLMRSRGSTQRTYTEVDVRLPQRDKEPGELRASTPTSSSLRILLDRGYEDLHIIDDVYIGGYRIIIAKDQAWPPRRFTMEENDAIGQRPMREFMG
eukprot:c9774_g1_i1 orf=157-510(-)